MDVKLFSSSDRNVKKFVFTFDGSDKEQPCVAEAVLYKYGSYKERTVICCSVQSGCPVGCKFCGTGRFFVRNLLGYEIADQVTYIVNNYVSGECNPTEIKKFQIMFMSMGEPFLNYEHVEQTIYYLHNKYPNAELLVSTSAPPQMISHMSDFISLSKNIDKVGLQFSVHESTDEARRKLIPTATCDLKNIAVTGEWWAVNVGRKPFFNYCVHEGNSTSKDASRLSELFNPKVWECTLSVICEKDETVKSSIDRQLGLIEHFNNLLSKVHLFSTRVFNPAGQDDIGGGCGQLWYFQEWLKGKQYEEQSQQS